MGWNRVMPEVVRGTRTENAEFFCGLQGLAQKDQAATAAWSIIKSLNGHTQRWRDRATAHNALHYRHCKGCEGRGRRHH
jgi:hypothetical protein